MSKRRHKVRNVQPKKVARSTKLYPIIWCTGENLAIAISKKIVSVKKDTTGKYKIRNRDQVNFGQWREWNSDFREGYEIDFSKYAEGELVHCPKCGEPIDFRVFPATQPPELTKVLFDVDDKPTKTD